jgi:hypothetical protein
MCDAGSHAARQADGLKRISKRGARTPRDLTWPQNGLAVSQKYRPHVDRNRFAIHPVTGGE